MKNIIYFFLLSSLLILTGANSDEILKAVLDGIVKEQQGHTSLVKFHINGYLGKASYATVWKGDYKGKTLAFKITGMENIFGNEVGAYQALNAVNNPDVEKHGIPNIYLHGNEILPPYWGIGMTLFEETLEDRWVKQDYNISDLSMLLIFKQAVKTLEYLNEVHVLHNDIKPANIFLRGSEVFFGDFNLASPDGGNDNLLGATPWFASSGYYANKTRTPMDDLESLVFSFWFMAGVEWDKAGWFTKDRQPEGKTLAEWKKRGKAKAKMMEKCKYFKNPHVQKAFELIAANEMLKDKHAPDYKLMTKILDDAIKKVHQGKGFVSINPPQFEWLAGQSSQTVTVRDIPIMGGSSDQSVIARDIPIMSGSCRSFFTPVLTLSADKNDWSVITHHE